MSKRAERHDLALASNAQGLVVVHRADCPEVRKLAAQGEPVMTLFGCERVPDDIQWHGCLDERERAGK